jgi:hypothetical protein
VSREVIGAEQALNREATGPAPHPVGPVDLIPTPRDAGHVPVAARRSDVQLLLEQATTGLCVLLVCGLAGWLGAGAWQFGQAPDELLLGLTASAVVVDVRPMGGDGVLTGANLDVQISDLGRAPLTLVGGQPSFDVGSFVGISPPALVIGAGASASASVLVAVACASPQPLRLPELRFRGPDGLLLAVPIDGSAAALAETCNQQPPDVRELQLISAQQDGPRLRLTVRSPTGRTTQVTGVSAGGVPLSGRPLPVTVDHLDATLWLDPLTACPVQWEQSGFPRTLDLQLDSGGESTLSLDVGFALISWATAGACAVRDR